MGAFILKATQESPWCVPAARLDAPAAKLARRQVWMLLRGGEPLDSG